MASEAVFEFDVEQRATALERYQRNADLPLMVLALAVIPLVALEYLGTLRPKAEEGLELTYALIWLAFLADYFIRLALTPRGARLQYVRHEWLALLLVVVTVPLPGNFLEIFRAARSFRLLRVFRFGAIAARGAQRVVALPKSANSQLAVAAACFVVVTLVSAVLVLAVEEGHQGSQINTMGHSLWWAVSTVTTSGFGDVVPRTTAGRLFALLPMIAGVMLVAVVASNFVERFYSNLAQRLSRNVTVAEELSQTDTRERLDELTRQIARLEATIRGNPSVPPA